MSINADVLATGDNVQRIDIIGRCSVRAKRTRRHDRPGATKIRNDVVTYWSARGTFFQSPLLLGLVNDPEVVDAGIGLGGLPGADKIGNPNRRQQADDRHDDHDLHQGEPRPGPPPHSVDVFHSCCFLVGGGRTKQPADLFI